MNELPARTTFCQEDFGFREIDNHDLSVLLRWQNASHIRAASFNDRIIGPEEGQQWFDSLRSNGRCHRLIFEYQGVPVGLISFSNLDKKNSTAYWGFHLGDTKRPKGIGTVLTYLGLEYAFAELHLRKINAEILAGNYISINLHRKLGFVDEGVFREHILKDGAYHDVLVLALFERDWRARHRSAVNPLWDYKSQREGP
jgi:UDP-4-amino-4,6-dideoxy-N-acetyl-beta-L-altrosamine N-acetyltransferase